MYMCMICMYVLMGVGVLMCACACIRHRWALGAFFVGLLLICLDRPFHYSCIPTDWLDWLACKPLGSSVSGMRGSHYKSHPFTWALRIWVQVLMPAHQALSPWAYFPPPNKYFKCNFASQHQILVLYILFLNSDKAVKCGEWRLSKTLGWDEQLPLESVHVGEPQH